MLLSDVVTLARGPLNDADPEDGNRRYRDETLLRYLNHGLLTAFRRRPDLFFGQYTSLPNGALALVDTFPLGNQYAQMLADYVTARAETTDDEFTVNGRAASFLALFEGG